ncbi:MAG TPA: hypothetical protein PLJ35_06000 [Anaerolineae bacterium]|nr:hypothetical protein [Anaerolineae bacterium]HOQ98357.1 hypothetical protein [Anaerolineae bacterium]HPL26591.1 hypothetical protein [Anaerolineae bacterium]
MANQGLVFEVADVEELYRGGKPSSWEEMIRRAEKAGGRRRGVSGPEAREMAYALRLLHERGGSIPGTARECYLQMYEVLEGIPGPGVYPA